MANPLMKVMLNNILVKEGKKTLSPATQSNCQNHVVNLKKEQESLLLNNVLHNKNSNSYTANQGYNSYRETTMLTLEDLRKPSSRSAEQAYSDRPSVIGKPMVSLVSIGKSNKV